MAPAVTIGDVNANSCVPRAMLSVIAIYTPSLSFIAFFTMFVPYLFLILWLIITRIIKSLLSSILPQHLNVSTAVINFICTDSVS